MKLILKTVILTAVGTVALCALASLTLADDAQAPRPDALLAALADAGKPGLEHEKLQPFIGDWALTMKMWTDPSQPPAEFMGTVERKWILGGRFVQESVQGECNGKPFEGLGLLGYHKGEKKFTHVRACGLCGTVSSSLATFDDSTKTFTCATEECCPLTGQKVEGRDEIVVESDDRIVMNVFKVLDGQEVKVMEIVSIRK